MNEGTRINRATQNIDSVSQIFNNILTYSSFHTTLFTQSIKIFP